MVLGISGAGWSEVGANKENGGDGRAPSVLALYTLRTLYVQAVPHPARHCSLQLGDAQLLANDHKALLWWRWDRAPSPENFPGKALPPR